MLIDAKADLNLADENGDTPLGIAARQGFLEIAKLLLAAKADVLKAGWNGETPLMSVINANQPALLDALLAAGARVDVKESREGQSPIHWSAADGRTAMVKRLIEKGADVKPVSNRGSTPLMPAARGGHQETLAELIKAGADPRAKRKDGWDALMRVVNLNQSETAAMRLETGADVETRDSKGNSLLHLTAKSETAELVKALIAKGAEVDAKLDSSAGESPFLGSKGERTPLQIASQAANIPVMKAFLEGGADVKYKTPAGVSAIFLSAASQRLAAVRTLVDAGADLNAQVRRGEPRPMRRLSCRRRT